MSLYGQRVYGYQPSIPTYSPSSPKYDQPPMSISSDSEDSSDDSILTDASFDSKYHDFFTIVVGAYYEELYHRSRQYPDMIVRVMRNGDGADFVNYGEVEPPVNILDAFVDRSTGRHQRSNYDWRELLSFLGLLVVDDSQFDYYRAPRNDFDRIV